MYITCLLREREIKAPMSDAYYLAKVLCMIKHKLISKKLFTQLNIMFDLSVNLFCDIVLFTDIIGVRKRRYMQKHKRIIRTFYTLRDIFQESASESDWLYFMFSIFCSPSYIGHTSIIVKRRNSHTSCSLLTKQTSRLYCTLHAIGMEHFTFLCIKIPPYLCIPLERILIKWFKPSLNTQHNSDFKSNILHDPTIPNILKSALTNFKGTSVHSSGHYNINSDLFKSPTIYKRAHQSVRQFPESFTVYHNPERDFSSLSLLSLITDYDKNKFQPFQVELNMDHKTSQTFVFYKMKCVRHMQFILH